MNVDQDELMEWLKKEFYASKAHFDSATDLASRKFHEGEMTAYQYLKYALETGEIKVSL